MTGKLRATVFDTHDASWESAVDRIRERLGAPNNPLLFPPHILKSAFPKIGGLLVEIGSEAGPAGYGFLFPRGVSDQGREFTFRYHAVDPGQAGEPSTTSSLVEEVLSGDRCVFYDPAEPHRYAASSLHGDPVDVGRPDTSEAQAVRRLQAEIWGSAPDLLYPADIHAIDFHLGSSLVVRDEGQVVGFLFGFYRFGGARLPDDWDQRFGGGFRIESQLLGVAPSHRRRGIAAILKRAQAEVARGEGIGIVNWTVDPLLWPNALLNFGELRAVSFEVYPNWYQFRNELNRVSASRLGITRLIGSPRVAAADDRAPTVDLSERPDVPRLNRGSAMTEDPWGGGRRRRNPAGLERAATHGPGGGGSVAGNHRPTPCPVPRR